MEGGASWFVAYVFIDGCYFLALISLSAIHFFSKTLNFRQKEKRRKQTHTIITMINVITIIITMINIIIIITITVVMVIMTSVSSP